MAKVIPVGPIDPVLYGFAKKQAEKAERDPRYVPKRLETHTHSITYRRVGAMVKAFVIDKIAPITFSTFGSATPVVPSFLRLHPELKNRPYKRADFSTASGQTKGWGIPENYALPPTNVIGKAPYHGTFKELTRTIDSSVELATGYTTLFDAARDYWIDEVNEFPEDQIQRATWSFPWPGMMEKINHGEMSLTRTLFHVYATTEAECDLYEKYTVYDAGAESSSNYHEYDLSYGYKASGMFLDRDIRLAAQDFESAAKAATVQCALDNIHNQHNTDSFNGSHATITTTVAQTSNSANVNVYDTFVAFDGGVLFSVLDVSAQWNVDSNVYDSAVEGGDVFTGTVSRAMFVKTGISKNLGTDRIASKEVLNENVVIPIAYGEWPYQGLAESTNAITDKHLFVAASVGGFDGIFIWTKIYESWPTIEKTQYATNSPMVKSHLAYFFDIFKGEYERSDAQHLEPPAITVDGACMPHAWFFCRGNETRQRTFHKNDYNRLSVVVYPQGKHEFAVDEADIYSVELDHTPRFVVPPGGAISFNIQPIYGANPVVPYVVNGLVQEEDENGEPTGFYLAGDGTVSGVFGAAYVAVTFKLSPRQLLDSHRLVTVETTTERIHGVKAHFEILGDGVRVPPGPQTLTLEIVEALIFSGQSITMYVTASHIANGSAVEYQVKRAGVVVDSGYVYISNGAGYAVHTPKFVVRDTYEPPNRYVLAQYQAINLDPVVHEFELVLLHENAPAPELFSVKYNHARYASQYDRPPALPNPPMLFLGASVSQNFAAGFLYDNNASHSLITRIWTSIKTKRVYVTFWDGKSCEVSNILKKNPESGLYEFNPDWKEAPFDYPPAVDPYGIKGTLEPYVYAYKDYEASVAGG